MKSKTTVLAFIALAVAAVSCGKESKPDPTQLTVEVTEVTAGTATITVTGTGDAPTLVRLTGAAELSTIGFELSDASGAASFATEKGSAISLPYTSTITGLEPFMEYAVAAVAFDSKMQVTDAKAVSFQTSAPDNAINEDGNGAGSVSDRTL